MAYNLQDKLVIGVSSCVLFNLQKENEIFTKEGKKAYCEYQIEHEMDVCEPGPGFLFIKSMLEINNSDHKRIEVILMSHNSAEVSLRLFRSIAYYGLEITRSVFTSGASLKPYLTAFSLDLFLSENKQDVQSAIDINIAAGWITDMEIKYKQQNQTSQIRFAFDGDAVLFSNESEKIYQKDGLEAFEKSEEEHAKVPMDKGPFLTLLEKLMDIKRMSEQNDQKIRTALVTSRSAPAHERVIRTLRAWNVKTDETFFLGGISKKEILEGFKTSIFFDDQEVHVRNASKTILSAQVLLKRD